MNWVQSNTALDPEYAFRRPSLSRKHKFGLDREVDQSGLHSSCHPAEWTDTTLVEAMMQVIANLHAQDQPVTRTGVLTSLAIGTVIIRKYPYARMLLERIGADGHQQHTAEMRARCRTDLSHYINQLKSWMQADTSYEDTKQRNIEREEELFQLVRGAIAELRTRKEQVTQIAVGKMIGRSPEGLKYYPRIRELLSQIADENRDPRNKHKIWEERGAELLREVTEIIRQMHAENKSLTQVAIAEQLFLTVPALKY